jgi:hypothetical protein
MTTESRSTRQPLDWMPLEIDPDNSKRGYHTIQHNPIPNPHTGGWTFTMFGHTPQPTVTDGYQATAVVELGTDHGAVVTRLVIEPSRLIHQGDDTHRLRLPDELPLAPVNSSTLSLIKFTEIANRIAEIEERYALFLEDALPTAGQEALDRATSVHKRGPKKNLEAHAKYAEQVLDSMRQGRGYQKRLAELYPTDWAGIEATRKRISRLRQDGWLRSSWATPGPQLLAYREEHGPDHWQKENT